LKKILIEKDHWEYTFEMGGCSKKRCVSIRRRFKLEDTSIRWYDGIAVVAD